MGIFFFISFFYVQRIQIILLFLIKQKYILILDMKFTYKEKEYELKYSFRALIIYENITKKNFNPTSISDILVFFYSILCSSGKGDVFDFNEFMDIIDENPSLVTEFSEWLTQTLTMNASLSPIDKEEAKKAEKEVKEEKN